MVTFDATHENRDLARGALRTGLAQALRLIIQIVSVTALSRLLSPEDFGVFAMVWPVMALANLLQDLGLTQATIQRRNITHEEVTYLFWINLTISALIAVALVAVSPFVAAFFDRPEAGQLTAALALVCIAAGLGAQHLAILNRQMNFHSLSTIEVGSALVGLFLSITLAFRGWGVWSLFAGVLSTTISSTVGAWVATGWHPSGPTRPDNRRSLLKFGAGITGFNFANLFARNLDNVLIGARWGAAELGAYDRAYKLLLLPLQQVNAPVGKVMLPALSQMLDQPYCYRRTYLSALAQLSLITLPGVAFMVGCAHTLIPALLGEQWRSVAPIFVALGVAGLVQPICNSTGWLFISQGRTSQFMIWGWVTATTTVAGFFAGLQFGAIGVAVAYAAIELARMPLLIWYVGREGPVHWRSIWRESLPHLAGAAASVVALELLNLRLSASASNPILILPVSALLSYGIAWSVIGTFPRGRIALLRGRRALCRMRSSSGSTIE